MLSIVGVTLVVRITTTFGGIEIHVDDTATGPVHDGSSWCSAFLYLQDAIAIAETGDTIRVAQGLYKPDQGSGQTEGDRAATFALLPAVTIAGGFAGCGALPGATATGTGPRADRV